MNTPDTREAMRQPQQYTKEEEAKRNADMQPMNTPDTEWRERLWEWVETAPNGVEVLNCYPESVVAIIEQAISSCNAYWKEVVRKEVEGMRMTRIQWAGTTDEQKNALLAIFDAHNQALDTLLDNLK